MDAIWNVQFGVAPAIAMALLHSLWQATLIAIAEAFVLAASVGRRFERRLGARRYRAHPCSSVGTVLAAIQRNGGHTGA